MRTEIRLSGSGGQGIITAGILLAQSAAIYDNKNSVQSQSYGPEARGGASKAEVIISDDSINYPKVTSPDILVALTQEAYDKYTCDLKESTVIIIDSGMVKEYNKTDNTYAMPIIEKVTQELGSSLSANIATVGVINAICKLVSDDGLLKTIHAAFPKKAEESNTKAYNIGVELANSLKG